MPGGKGRKAGWTGHEPLPGGDFAIDGFETMRRQTAIRYPFLPPALLHRLLRAYGTDIHVLLKGSSSMADLGPVLGADLTTAEIRYLACYEWARTADDIVWRRSKLGLRMNAAEIQSVDDLLAQISAGQKG
jgi:glycerol-3-phosphate dehydrogenase